jgi:hypothetical protein
MVVVTSILWIGYLFLLYFTVDDDPHRIKVMTNTKCVFKSEFGIVGALAVIYLPMVIIFITLFKRSLGKVTDSLGCIADLKWCLVLWITAIVSFSLMKIIDQYGAPVAMVICFWLNYLRTWTWHTLKAWNLQQHVPKMKEENVEEHITLKNILEDPGLVQEFRKFLEDEWCSENLLFLMEYKELEKMTKGSKRYRMIKRMYSTYFNDHSMMQLNISSEVSSHIKKRMADLKEDDEEVSSIIFQEAYDEIYELLKNDSVPRFNSKLSKTRAQSS